jgi:hypothetical protein
MMIEIHGQLTKLQQVAICPFANSDNSDRPQVYFWWEKFNIYFDLKKMDK